MAFDVSLGQYYEGNSLIHKLDPRTKLFYVIMFMVATFVAKSIYAFLFLFLMVVLSILISRVPIRTILKGLKPLIVIVIFTAILNIFWTKGENPLWVINIIPNRFAVSIYKEGLIKAALLALRIVMLLANTDNIRDVVAFPKIQSAADMMNDAPSYVNEVDLDILGIKV